MVSIYMIMLFYVLLTLVLAYLGNLLLGYGYYAGFILGLLISIILWYLWGSANAKY
jgi:hypothetical protein